MKKFGVLVISLFMLILFSGVSGAGETYSKFLGGIGIGDLNACLDRWACVDEDTEPKLDTDAGWTFQAVPLAYKTKVTSRIELAFEPTFFVAHREFDLEYTDGKSEYSYKYDGDNTEYGLLANLLGRYKLGYRDLVPYIGAGIGYKYSTFDIDKSCTYEGKRNYKGCRRFRNGQSDPHPDFVRVWTYLAGVEFPLLGDLKGNLQYQYMGSDRVRGITTVSGRGVRGAFDQANVNLNSEHLFSVGFTF